MTPFSYAIARSEQLAFDGWTANPGAMYVAGATDVMQLLREDVVQPATLIDISRLPLTMVEASAKVARIGALARLADVADDPGLQRHFPLLTTALAETASGQVRNLATMGGNLLQRTRCLYFRDRSSPCNKRRRGSGCPAIHGANRMNAILGCSDQCIAAYPGDMAIALLVLGACVQVRGPQGERFLPINELHRMPGADPVAETTLQAGEIITEIVIPSNAFDGRTAYLKVRDRAHVRMAVGLGRRGAGNGRTEYSHCAHRRRRCSH